MMMPYNQSPPPTNSDAPDFPSWEAVYCMLPPEANSDFINPDAPPFTDGSLSEAGAHWGALAQGHKGLIDHLNRWCTQKDAHWVGPAARLMHNRVDEYREWLDRFTAQVSQTANQYKAICKAAEEATNALVKLELIKENRAAREELVASNVLGEDEKIAELDRTYDEFWATDVNAMRHYEQSVLNALRALPSWEEPPQVDGRLTVDHYWPDRGQRMPFFVE